MSSSTSKDNDNPVTVRPVTADNWREVAKLKVTEAQRDFVAEPCYYLALCCYGEIWHPLAVYLGTRVIGFMMWGIDPADGSCWLGGIMIDQSYQRQGYGRQAIQAAMMRLAEEHGCQDFALSYAPDNAAKYLYYQLGFIETPEWEDNEIVARLSLEE